MINHNIYPRIPSRGSVGASGDLAPLAHMAGALIGDGEVRVDGRLVRRRCAAGSGIEPMRLAPKEGLALLNGTQVSTALALAAVFRTENVLSAALVAGAMSSDAIKGSDTPFDQRIQNVRGHGGQIAVAGVLRELMHGSDIRASHEGCDRVQDPYSIRCQPQVVGACLDVLRHVCCVLETEANAVTDNPLVFTDSGVVLSGGNFHAEPVALAADYLALAIAEIGALSERRIALLIDSHMSGLPAFLVKDGGLNSGFMMAQVTAAALASENKSHAHPASVDSLPTSANQEDHVSMATFAARRLHTCSITSPISLRSSCWRRRRASNFIDRKRVRRLSRKLSTAFGRFRQPMRKTDRLSPDIRRVATKVNRAITASLRASVLPSLSCMSRFSAFTRAIAATDQRAARWSRRASRYQASHDRRRTVDSRYGLARGQAVRVCHRDWARARSSQIIRAMLST